MPSIAERKKRKQESVMLRQARLDLLAELDQLKGKTCEKCRLAGSRNKGSFFTCDCSVATRMREIGQELSVLINERIEVPAEEVKEVAKENNFPTLTEAVVNAMRDKGMTYTAIAKHFGISAPTLATRRQNWELERVRAQHKPDEKAVEPSKSESVTVVDTEESSVVPSLLATCETKIAELKDAIRLKDGIIQEQQDVIDQLRVACEKLANRSEPSNEWKEEIRDERKLLAFLLEREAARIKNLLEVG